MKFLYHPYTILTSSDHETLALNLISEIPIPGVDAAAFDSGIIRQTLLQAAVDQKSIKAVTNTTCGTHSDDYTLAQLHTVPPDELETVVNELLVQQATMIPGPGPRIICIDFVVITALHTLRLANSVTLPPRWHLSVPSLPCWIRPLSGETAHRRSHARP